MSVLRYGSTLIYTFSKLPSLRTLPISLFLVLTQVWRPLGLWTFLPNPSFPEVGRRVKTRSEPVWPHPPVVRVRSQSPTTLSLLTRPRPDGGTGQERTPVHPSHTSWVLSKTRQSVPTVWGFTDVTLRGGPTDTGGRRSGGWRCGGSDTVQESLLWDHRWRYRHRSRDSGGSWGGRSVGGGWSKGLRGVVIKGVSSPSDRRDRRHILQYPI